MGRDREDRPVPAKKDKKRWCRGKVGVEHVPKCFNYLDLHKGQDFAKDWRIFACINCGKELDYWHPRSASWINGPPEKPKPAWVTA